MSDKLSAEQEQAIEQETEQLVDELMEGVTDEMIEAALPKLVQEDSTVEIRYKLTLMDGTLVDETEGNETFTFTLGEGQMLNKLEELLIGLEIGTTGTFVIPPEGAFGEPDPANIHTLSRNEFPPEMEVKEKMVIGFEGPDGSEIPGWIVDIEGDEVTVDFNHPLSGQTIQFEATIMDIKS